MMSRAVQSIRSPSTSWRLEQSLSWQGMPEGATGPAVKSGDVGDALKSTGGIVVGVIVGTTNRWNVFGATGTTLAAATGRPATGGGNCGRMNGMKTTVSVGGATTAWRAVATIAA